MKPIFLSVLLGLSLTACNRSTSMAGEGPTIATGSSVDLDKDGVPNVELPGTIMPPTTTSVRKQTESNRLGGTNNPAAQRRMVTVGGRQMELRDFLLTYCQSGNPENATCNRAQNIYRVDVAHNGNPVAKLPPGL